MDGLALHLVQLIKEKEKQSVGMKCIISEAVKPEHINSAGTFRYFHYLLKIIPNANDLCFSKCLSLYVVICVFSCMYM